MPDQELERLLEAWEEACVVAHGGTAIRFPTLVAAKLMQAGDNIINYIKDHA